MVLNVNIERHSKNASGAIHRAQKKRLERGADIGFATALDQTPSGASQTLRFEMFEPEWQGEQLIWGNGAPYAEHVEYGTEPHWIPVSAMDSLKRWAKRILGNEDAAWAVRYNIAQHGTPAQEFMAAGAERQREYYRTNPLSKFLDRELD